MFSGAELIALVMADPDRHYFVSGVTRTPHLACNGRARQISGPRLSGVVCRGVIPILAATRRDAMLCGRMVAQTRLISGSLKIS
jgi:hypothetical protein